MKTIIFCRCCLHEQSSGAGDTIIVIRGEGCARCGKEIVRLSEDGKEFIYKIAEKQGITYGPRIAWFLTEKTWKKIKNKQAYLRLYDTPSDIKTIHENNDLLLGVRLRRKE